MSSSATGPGSAPEPRDRSGLAGRLLISSPALQDANFDRTVVLVVDHDDDGALGVVLNRPTTVPVLEILPGWAGHLADGAVVHGGGPVGTDSALGLARVDADEDPVGFRRVAGPFGVVDLDVPPDLLTGALDDFRIFAGYAGWSAGQLESEIANEAWFVVDALPADPFRGDPADLWRDVLRRQPGPLAWLSTAPADPTMN